MNMKVFNLIFRTNQTRHETCTCKCRLHASVCNNKKWGNKSKCRWECKELIVKDKCEDGFIWNPSICECESDKSCNVGDNLDTNCKYKKRLIEKYYFNY